VRYAFIERYRTVRPIARQCQVLKVSASGYRSVISPQHEHTWPLGHRMSGRGGSLTNAVAVARPVLQDVDVQVLGMRRIGPCGKVSRIHFRADAGFANPEVYQYLEGEGIKYAIRLPANRVLQERIGYLLKRPVGRPSLDVRRSYANFTYQAGSWTKPRRVVAKVARL
jgi:hypothetical protein